MNKQIALLIALTGCSCSYRWDDVPTAKVRTDAPAEHLLNWRIKIDDAIASWNEVLPEGCPEPFERDEVNGRHLIRLVPLEDWPWDSDMQGAIDGDNIDVRLNQTSVKETAMHELGHALGLDDIDNGHYTIMTSHAGGPFTTHRPSAYDGRLAACELDCGPCD